MINFINRLFFLGFYLALSVLSAPFAMAMNDSKPPYTLQTKLEVDYPQIIGLSNASAQLEINKALYAHVQKFIASCVTVKEPANITSEQALKAAEIFKKDKRICTYDNKIIQPNNDIIVIQFNEFYHDIGEQGAARTYKNALNFDIKQKKIIILRDLFKPNSNYISLLSQQVRHYLQFSDVKSYLLDNQYKQGTAPEINNFKDFLLDRNDLVIYFQPLQVAADVAGVVEVRIPYKNLCAVMSRNYSNLSHC